VTYTVGFGVEEFPVTPAEDLTVGRSVLLTDAPLAVVAVALAPDLVVVEPCAWSLAYVVCG